MKKLEKPQQFFVHKNYSDATAVLMYGASCSLIHFAMLFTSMFVKRPNLE